MLKILIGLGLIYEVTLLYNIKKYFQKIVITNGKDVAIVSITIFIILLLILAYF